MTFEIDLQAFLDGASLDPEIQTLRPDYRAALVAVSGIVPTPSDDASETELVRAENAARHVLSTSRVEELPHVAAWRDAYRAFGAKPQRTRNSVEALLRRAATGLPRVNKLTDLYNSVSVRHIIPLGGEDLNSYRGSPRLVRANGTEVFDTLAQGQPVEEQPDRGEVIWRDDVGVTCRRWNWRQGQRTQLQDETTSAVFILDALQPITDAALDAAVDDLIGGLRTLGPEVKTASRILRRSDPDDER